MEIKRIRCKEISTGRTRMIVEPLATNPAWMKKRGMIVQEIEKPVVKEVIKPEIVEEAKEVFNSGDIFDAPIEEAPRVIKRRKPRTKK